MMIELTEKEIDDERARILKSYVYSSYHEAMGELFSIEFRDLITSLCCDDLDHRDEIEKLHRLARKLVSHTKSYFAKTTEDDLENWILGHPERMANERGEQEADDFPTYHIDVYPREIKFGG